MRKQCPGCHYAHTARTTYCPSCDQRAMFVELGVALALLVGGLSLAALLTAVLS